MLLLRHPKYNVALQRLRGSLSVRSISDLRQPSIHNDPCNAFVQYDANAPFKVPKRENLVNCGHEASSLPTFKHIDIAVKDNICTLDYPTTCASKILNGHQSPYEATVVTLLKQHGMRIVGKTNMDEFGMGSHSINSYFGPVFQRFTGPDGEEMRYSAGGSSGGSAVAVQQLMCTAAIGTDTGGSVRLPAAWCGVVGFKPSYGVISRWGVIDYANSLDTVGILARTANEVMEIFNAVRQPDNRDPTSLPTNTAKRIFQMYESTKEEATVKNESATGTRQLTIGVPYEYNIAELHPSVRQAWHEALESCLRHGHNVVRISLPTTKSALSAYYVLAPAEASSNLAKYDGVRYGTRAEGADGANGVLFSKTRAEGFGDEVKRRILLGSYSLSANAIDNYFIQAQKVRRMVQTEFNEAFVAPHPLFDAPVASSPDAAFDLESGPDVTSATFSSQQKVDFILCPTAPTPPPRLKDLEKQNPVDAYINDVFTVPASLAGLPAISIPWGVNSTMTNSSQVKDPSTNIGLQIIGQYGHDLQVLDFAHQLGKMRSTMN